VNMRVDYTTVPTVLAPLMLAALFIERAVEVIISPWRDEGAERLRNKMASANRNTAAVSTQQAVTDELTQYKGKTRRYAFTIALLLGMASAMVGVRAVWPFVDDANGVYIAAHTSKDTQGNETEVKAQGNPINDPNQQYFKRSFIVVDVLLSALMLAGGANGIHSIVTAFTSFFDNAAQRNQGVPG